MNICFVIGCNGTGKSTLMDRIKKKERFGTVEVGRTMRAKYPPEHFKGHSNPDHTRAEAYQMMLDGMAAAFVAGKEAVFVDGQPRDVKQTEDCLRLWPDATYLHLWADDDLRKQRCLGRDGDDPEKFKLSTARHESDSINNYKVLCRLLDAGATIHTDCAEQCSGYDFEREYERIICRTHVIMNERKS